MPVQLSKLTPATRLFSTRERLVDTGLYLGHMSLWDSVHWVRDGRADRLAIKPAEPSDVGKCLPSPPDDDSSFDLAPILAVVHIDSNDYWLTADVNYRGPSEIWPDYANIKPSCVCQMPDIPPFTADWANVTDNLHWLQDQVAIERWWSAQGRSSLKRREKEICSVTSVVWQATIY